LVSDWSCPKTDGLRPHHCPAMVKIRLKIMDLGQHQNRMLCLSVCLSHSDTVPKWMHIS